jgi:hypothetical protein
MTETIESFYYNIINSSKNFKFLINTENYNSYHCVYRNDEWYLIDEALPYQNLNDYPILSYKILENIDNIKQIERYIETNNYAAGEYIVRLVDLGSKYTLYNRS